MGKKIEIPERVYKQLAALDGQSRVNQTVARILREYLVLRKQRANDPFFQKRKSYSSGLSDVSENHDDYLYGEKSKLDDSV